MGIGLPELLIIGGIIVLLFGAKKIPEIASGIGKGLKEFKKAKKDMEGDVNEPEKEKENYVKNENKTD